MDIHLKKRLVGILILLGLGLLLFPLFFNQNVPHDEMKLSGNIPPPPEKPQEMELPLPDANQTLPTTAIVAQSPSTKQANSAAARVVFEQEKSTDSSSSSSSTVQITSNLPTPSSTDTQPSEPNASYPSPENLQEIKTTPSQTTLNQIPSKSQKNAVISPAAWAVQLGSFSDKINAMNLVKKLQSLGFPAYLNSIKTANGSEMIKVRVGPQLKRSDANAMQQKLQQQLNLQGIVVKVDR